MQHEILQTARENFAEFTTQVQFVINMNLLDFEVIKSKVKLVTAKFATRAYRPAVRSRMPPSYHIFRVVHIILGNVDEAGCRKVWVSCASSRYSARKGQSHALMMMINCLTRSSPSKCWMLKMFPVRR